MPIKCNLCEAGAILKRPKTVSESYNALWNQCTRVNSLEFSQSVLKFDVLLFTT